MWSFIARRVTYNIPVYLGILLLVMAALRANDPVWSFLGKNATLEQYESFQKKAGLDKPFVVQYGLFLADVIRLNFETHSWDKPGHSVGELLGSSIVPSLSLTAPALLLSTMLSISVGLLSAYYRGRAPDRLLMIAAVLGMSVSFLVYIILGQYFGAYRLNDWLGHEVFAIEGWKGGLRNWPHYCLLPVLISVIVSMGYDTRFYRAVMVEESGRDYITTARAKGATKRKIMFVHMLKNALIPIITRVMITLPFLVVGSILLEWYFNIPGMGRTLLTAINARDFPVIQTFTAMFAALFIATNILTDVLYAVVDPRVRLQMIATVRRFLASREVSKLRRSRLAMLALLTIAIYVLVGGAVLVLDAIPLEDTTARVGPDGVPGFFGSQRPEKRLQDCEFYLDRFDSALGKSDAGMALSELRFAERRPRELAPDALKARVEAAWTLYEEIAHSANLNEDPSLLPRLSELETATAALFAPLSGGDANRYRLRTLLGTDRQGRSILVRAVYSIKVALQIGAVTAFISVLFGSLLGAAAAFFGGWVDHLVIWLYSTFSSIPNLVLLTVLVYMFTGSVFDGTLIPVYAAFCMTFWIGPCRVIRGETMRLKELEYVQAATAIGFSRPYILIRHILPNTAHLMLINFSLLFIGAIKSEVILSFLGLGVKKGASWGIMIKQSGQEVVNGFFWQIGAATFFMVILVLAFNILSDALQDAFDPRHVS